MSATVARFVLLLMLLPAAHLAAQTDRPSCVIMKGLDLKPLLGDDHDKPVPFGQDSCRAESNSPGRLIVLAVEEGNAAELKSAIATHKKMNVEHRAKEATIAPEPSLGPDAFSVREKGGSRGIEIYALKGSRFVNIQGSWPHSKPLDDASARQLVALVKATLDKLP